MRNCFVNVDFDGTCVTNEYPKVGKDIGADVWLRSAVALGARLILWTMRDGDELERALDWFTGHDIEVDQVNENQDQATWSTSPKIFGHIYVTVAACCTPVISPGPREREFVDWSIMGPTLLGKIAGKLNQ